MSFDNGAVDSRQVIHAAIASFLEERGYISTLSCFRDDAAKAGWSWPVEEKERSSSDQKISLEDLIDLHRANVSLQKQQRLLAKKLLSKNPTELTLAGPSTLNYKVVKTHANLHSSNILHLSIVDYLICNFSTSEARYVTSSKRLLCSTAAEKNIVFSEIESGEMVEVFEPGSGAYGEDRHSAAVLWVAQSPHAARKREFVSCGMDGKVIIWDLLYQQPIQVLRHHTKFVVNCAFSQSGDYLASCSYDKTICIYKRSASISSVVDSEEDIGKPPILDVQYHLAHSISTTNNPESIIFVRARASPSKNDPGLGKDELILGSINNTAVEDDEEEIANRTYLAYTVRSDCFINYVALPLEADSDVSSSDEEVAALTEDLERTKMTSTPIGAIPDWTVLHFNTNENRSDYHVSYSLMHLTLHPTGKHICIQTGDHSIPSTGYAPSSSSLSRILIMPLLSSLRSTTLWTGVESSGFATIRHDWLPDGSAAWLTSEEGFARLVDTKGKIRAKVSAHGAAADEVDEIRRAATWSRGGNSLIKSLVVLDEKGSVATCGYDRTIRIIQRA